MATSYGSITITDKTDLGRLSVFLQGSTVKQQVYDGNTLTYYPNWDTSNSGTALLLTPYVYYDNTLVFDGTTANSQVHITWKKTENGTDYGIIPKSPTTSDCPEALSNFNRLNRPINLTPGSIGAIYTATITYYPISGDNNVYLTAIATFDLSITQYGVDGDSGTPGKTLQLNGTGSHFTYTYDNNLFGAQTITMTAQIKNTASTTGVHWYCDNILIKNISGSPSTDTNNINYASAQPYTTLSLQVAGDSSTSGVINISNISSNFTNNKYTQFKIVEIDSSGIEVTEGLVDYFNIYKYMEAAPGEGAYLSYLDNDEETIIEYNGIPQLGNAVSRLYITHDGMSDMDNWHISVSDNIATAADFVYTLSNSRDNNGSSTYLNKYGPDTVVVTTMNVTTARITFTAEHGSYSGNSFIKDNTVADLINSFSLSRSASIVSHSLRLDAVNANKAADSNTYTPATIEVDAITRTGGGTNEYRNAGVISAIVHLTNGNLYNFGTSNSPVYYISNINNNTLTLTLDNYGSISYIETFLGGTYNSSSHTFDNAEDKQKISISSNGVDGTPTWQVNLTNVFDSISTNSNNIVRENKTYEIPFEVFEGITEKTVRYGGTTYPIVSVSWSSSDATSTITPLYYNGSTRVTTNNSVVDRIKFSVTGGTTNIGSEGTFTFTFNLDGTNTVERIYSYKAYPAALNAINIQIYGTPSTTFTNQNGTIYLEPVITEGTNNITDNSVVTKYTWYIYDDEWKIISNTSTSTSGYYYNSNIKTGHYSGTSFVTSTNGSNDRNSKILQIGGAAIDGYAYFKVIANITVVGNSGTYTGYIPVTDIDDPIQVTLHSTLGLQLVNGQGAGVVYARVVRNNEELDPIAPDDVIGIGTTAPSGTRNDGNFAGKLGYFVYSSGNNSNYLLTYYYRTSTSDTWIQRTNSNCIYHWTFRNSDNEPINYSDTGLAANIAYILEHDTNTQFFYLNKDVVDKKLSADVRVTI